MTRKSISILSLILVVQIGLAAGLIWQQNKNQGVESAPLLASIGAEVDRLDIETEGKTLTLTKQASGWTLENGLPVQQSRVASVLDKLGALTVTWPVASSESAHKRLEVHEDTFQKQVRFYSGDALQQALFLGSSPSYRQVHVRKADQDDVYAVGFDSFELTTSDDAWLDNTLLRPSSEVREITEADSSFDASDSEPLVKALSQLTVLGVNKNVSDLEAADRLDFSVTTTDQSVSYQLLAKDSEYFIQSSAYDAAFRVSKSQYDALVKAFDEVSKPVAVSESGSESDTETDTPGT